MVGKIWKRISDDIIDTLLYPEYVYITKYIKGVIFYEDVQQTRLQNGMAEDKFYTVYRQIKNDEN